MKRIIALLLVLLMAASVLAACGDDKTKKYETNKSSTSDEASKTSNSQNDKVTENATQAVIENATQSENKVPTTTAKELTQAELLGTWNMEVSMAQVIDYMLDNQYANAEQFQQLRPLYDAMCKDIYVTCFITFEADEYEVEADKASLSAMKDQIIDNTIDYMRNGGLVDIFAAQGQNMTQKEIEAQITKEGMTMQEFYQLMAESMSKSMDMESMVDELGDGDGDYAVTSNSLWIDMNDDELGVRSEFKYTYDGQKITLTKQVEGKDHPYTGAVLTRK